MKRTWQRVAGRIDALSLRERVWIFAVSVLLVLTVAHEGFLDPEFKKAGRLSAGLLQKQAESRAMQVQLAALLQGRSTDPDAAAKEGLRKLQASLTRINAQIAAEERRFTAPAQMQKVLHELLARNRGVQLVELKSLPAVSLAELQGGAGAAPGSDAARLIFRHGFELVVTGSYLELLAYLAELERMPTQLYWGALDMQVLEHPKLSMKLTVYTLSLDRAWMSV